MLRKVCAIMMLMSVTAATQSAVFATFGNVKGQCGKNENGEFNRNWVTFQCFVKRKKFSCYYGTGTRLLRY